MLLGRVDRKINALDVTLKADRSEDSKGRSHEIRDCVQINRRNRRIAESECILTLSLNNC